MEKPGSILPERSTMTADFYSPEGLVEVDVEVDLLEFYLQRMHGQSSGCYEKLIVA